MSFITQSTDTNKYGDGQKQIKTNIILITNARDFKTELLFTPKVRTLTALQGERNVQCTYQCWFIGRIVSNEYVNKQRGKCVV